MSKEHAAFAFIATIVLGFVGFVVGLFVGLDVFAGDFGIVVAIATMGSLIIYYNSKDEKK